MLLNADAIKIESVWELMRPAATAAGPNTNLYAEIVEVINSMKVDAAKRNLTAYKAWLLVAGLCTREHGCSGINTLQSNFMLNLKRIGMLNYMLVPTEHQHGDMLFQAEEHFDWDLLTKSRNKTSSLFPCIENKTTFLKKSQDRTEHIFEINSKGKLVIIPKLSKKWFRQKSVGPASMENVGAIVVS